MDTNKKYHLTDETITVGIRTLHRIIADKNFGDVKAGDLGGFVESEKNLSQAGNAWIYGNAQVYEYAQVCGDARVYDNARVCGDALVYGKAQVYDKARVYGNAQVCDNAQVCGNAWVYGDVLVYGSARVCGDARVWGNAQVCGSAEIKSIQDYIVFKNWWSSGRYFTWTRSNNKYKVGCFYGTGDELIKKAYQDSKTSGREYERIVKYVESILNNN